MKSVGVVLVQLPDRASENDTCSMVLRGSELVPDGRVLAICYQLPDRWEQSIPYESISLDILLGEPSSREGKEEWEFFGNLAVRVCKEVDPHLRNIDRELGILLLRRVGDKPYVRRGRVSTDVLSSSTLPVLHSVFTRDVANNVWHLPVRGFRQNVRKRLGAILAWSDECVMVVTERSQRGYANEPLNLDSDLIGIPTKTFYDWSPFQPTLFTVEG